MENTTGQKVNINEGDILKVFAVSGAILQSVLGMFLKYAHTNDDLALLGVIFNIVKYTAPVFIFAIVYGMVKNNQHTKVSHFYKEKFGELVIPYFLWAAAGLIFFPEIQVNQHVASLWTLIESLVLGNASSQFWYTVMMLQFQLLMPVLIFICYKYLAKPSRVIPLLIVSFVIFGAWLWMYDAFVFQGAYATSLRYLDRFFVSYFIYALVGGIAWVYKERFDGVLRRIQFILLPVVLLILIWTNREFFSFGFEDMSFGNLIYLKPSMTLYSLVVIFLIYMLARHLISLDSRSLPYYKWFSTYAYRAFTANVFILVIVLRLFGDLIGQLPFFMALLLVYLTTVACSFGVVYAFAQIKVWAEGVFLKQKRAHSINH
ncbi:acyltransferase family protein [Paenibacillus sp. CMAA1739]|uniref:acyltransferase family protein n=1 Tax=Paenibacillus ottowii TaxID=2315729 RepID=UPI00273145D7|nr:MULTISPECIES: acyltransferase family protein [Paenibacillus]MDP1511382.1 acyltransferase family protein [Paenibacillus ottowii]MEC4568524.1 acyltransferase family protein [Paenibacillus sp. CMAA1739]